MGTSYKFDREFTDYIHENVAIPKIYQLLKWYPQDMNSILSSNVDMNNAVDYFFIDDKNKRIVTVQERFREVKYRNYDDFTVRFEREHSHHADRKLSEYYKLNADYFVYGIVNASKFDKEKATDFIKFAVIDLKKIRRLIDVEKRIIIDRELRSLRCSMIGGKMHCPVNQNRDFSSSFFPIDIKLLLQFYSEDDVVILQKGFI